MARKEELLTDAQWKKLEPLLPEMPKSNKGGRPWADNRDVMEGILWILKTGARWRDLPRRYPSPSTCWRRLKIWEEEGVWLLVWSAFLEELDTKGLLEWSECFMDGSFAPAKKGALLSVQPRGGRAQSGWWWSTARVFLSEHSWRLPRYTRSSSSRKR